MEPYVHDVLYRNAQEMRVHAAPHTRHLHEAMAARAAVRRRRRLAWLRSVVVMLVRHQPAARGPAAAGGHPG